MSMRTLLFALITIGTTAFSAQAQSLRFSGESEEVYWLVGFSVSKTEVERFKSVVRQMVARTTKEPGTLEYQYNIGPDGTTVDIFERYTDSDAAIAHVTQMSATPLWKEFTAVAKPIPGRFMVYGKPSMELKKVLEGFNPTYFSTIDGFTKY